MHPQYCRKDWNNCTHTRLIACNSNLWREKNIKSLFKRRMDSKMLHLKLTSDIYGGLYGCYDSVLRHMHVLIVYFLVCLCFLVKTRVQFPLLPCPASAALFHPKLILSLWTIPINELEMLVNIFSKIWYRCEQSKLTIWRHYIEPRRHK